MFLNVKEAIDYSGKSQTTIHRLCQKYESTKFIEKENNRYLIDKNFLEEKYPNENVVLDPTELVNPATGDNLLKSLTEKNLKITALTVENGNLKEIIETKEKNIGKLKDELLDSNHELAETTDANLQVQKELSAVQGMQYGTGDYDSEDESIDKDKQLIRYQLIGITISVMALASFIFALYYLTR